MLATGTLVEYGLTFIDTAQLHRIIPDRLMTAPHTGFVNGRSHQGGSLLLRLLFGVTLGPQRCRSRTAVGGSSSDAVVVELG